MVAVLPDEAPDTLDFLLLLPPDLLQQLLLAFLQDAIERVKAQAEVLLLPSPILLWGEE